VDKLGKRDKRLDWLTTALMILVPSILIIQDNLIQAVPPEYAVLATFIFGLISQIFTEGRVQSVKDKYKRIETWSVDDISTLYDLKEKKVITEEEFQEKKDQLLNL
jgi:hypothetical protein